MLVKQPVRQNDGWCSNPIANCTPTTKPTAIMFMTFPRIIIALLIISSLPVSADEGSGESKWKLSPLAYNNPGLKVDLGVGLWAWPLPMDYDDDGDMDLLVACPDKPSNGVFFFENAMV